MRKVERLVNLIALLLDTRRPLTLDQVAELVPGYEASGESLRRMFERDKEELRGLGVPVERAPIDAWGTEEGYFIDPKAYGMPELDLAPDERAALALAARAWSGAARDPAAVAGLAKLDLDPGAGPHALRADLHGANPLLTTLLEAVQGRKRIAFTYRPPGRDAAERQLDPYALVHQRGTWYVVGHDAARDALRSFRLSRIESDVRRLRPSSRGPDFEVPAGFEPRQVLQTAGEPAGGPTALVRAPEAAARLAELRGGERTGRPAPDGRVELRVPIGDRDGLLGWATGNQAEIVEPAELREAARRRLAALLEVVS
jgi:predicted DNA-binding transcriptional regulator YafY